VLPIVATRFSFKRDRPGLFYLQADAVRLMPLKRLYL